MYCKGGIEKHDHQLSKMTRDNYKMQRSALIKCIHEYLIKRANPDNSIRRKTLMACLGIGFHIPKRHQLSVVKELEGLGIIFNNNRDWFKVKKKKII